MPKDKCLPVHKMDTKSGGRRPYISAYKRAEMEYERISKKRIAEAGQRQLERERCNELANEYQSFKKRMNKVLKRKTTKGQPKLDAQIEVLLEKIQKRVHM